MLTTRGRVLALVAIAGTLLSVLRSQDRTALIAFSLLMWIVIEWLWFRWMVASTRYEFTCVRSVNGHAKESLTMWAGRAYAIQVQLTSDRKLFRPMLFIEDVLSENFEVIDGSEKEEVSLSTETIELRYTVRPRGVGRFVMKGLVIESTDRFGLLRHRRFVPVPMAVRVLPSFIGVDDFAPSVKRSNSLPPPGIHRLQRAGMGSELLELREYVPGDPPKAIAWKVSARRDKLMTRQYESEVPVRTVLFLDQSTSTRVGGFGQRLLDQMTFTAASIARSAMSTRDPVGLVTFNETSFERLDPSGGERHFYQILSRLSESAVADAPPTGLLSKELIEAGWRLAQEQYPELLTNDVNVVPWSLFPILPWSVRRWRRRYRLAAFLTEHFSHPPLATLQMSIDDHFFARELQRFLGAAGNAWLEPLIAPRERGFHECLAKIQPLTAALNQAIARGRDNELYVILIDLLDCASERTKLIKPIRSALARHHRVVIICPTPDFRRPERSVNTDQLPKDEHELLMRAEQSRLNRIASKLQREIRRTGASISFSADARSIRMVLAEADLARNGRTTHTRGGR